MGQRVPQSVQNLVIRDYCQRKGLQYLLSSVEYAEHQSYRMLSSIIEDSENLSGIVAYSVFQMPISMSRRLRVFQELISRGKEIHFALEGLAISEGRDIDRVNDLWGVRKVIDKCPTTKELWTQLDYI